MIEWRARGRAGGAGAAATALAAGALVVTIAPLPAVPRSSVADGQQEVDAGRAPQFEVATIRITDAPSDPRARHAVVPATGQLTITNVMVSALIQEAYDVQLPSQIVNMPDWARSQRVDVVAKAAAPSPAAVLQQMLRPLLAEHFRLVVRREMREMDALALVVVNRGRLGPRLTTSDAACDGALGTSSGFARAADTPVQGAQCGILPGGAGRIMARGLDMPALADLLASAPRRVVIDRTELAGRFDIDLTYTPETFSAGALAQRPGATPPPGVDPSGPPLATALQEQLGLKLESVRAPVEVLVIERIEPLSVDPPSAR